MNSNTEKYSASIGPIVAAQAVVILTRYPSLYLQDMFDTIIQ